MAYSDIIHPNACCLSTVGIDGYPEGRMVLLKSFDEAGFVFYTNVESVKGQALKKLPRAALTFYWEQLGKQVRIQGDAALIDPVKADEYSEIVPGFSSARAGGETPTTNEHSTRIVANLVFVSIVFSLQ